MRANAATGLEPTDTFADWPAIPLARRGGSLPLAGRGQGRRREVVLTTPEGRSRVANVAIRPFPAGPHRQGAHEPPPHPLGAGPSEEQQLTLCPHLSTGLRKSRTLATLGGHVLNLAPRTDLTSQARRSSRTDRLERAKDWTERTCSKPLLDFRSGLFRRIVRGFLTLTCSRELRAGLRRGGACGRERPRGPGVGHLRAVRTVRTKSAAAQTLVRGSAPRTTARWGVLGCRSRTGCPRGACRGARWSVTG